MTTARKGNTTEAAVLGALVKRDFAVLVPFGDGQPYDLVVHLGAGQFGRIQCKTARLQKGCVLFNSRSTDHGRGQGTYLGLADLFGVYCPPTGSVYLVPVQEVPTSVVHLRLEPARNNQHRGIRLAADYEIDRLTIDGLRELVGRSKRESDPVAVRVT
ncbi:MAG: group I intron-associated PD-(D/E)XK endonuclease [Solirubrobacterales bacterium]